MDPEILTTKEAHTYVGGRPCFEELIAAFPKILVPFRRTATRGCSYYSRDTINKAIRAAELSQALVHELTDC